MFRALILLICIIHVINGERFPDEVGDWESIAVVTTCTSDPVIPADKGVGDANDRDACAARCEATPACTIWMYKGSDATNHCHYFNEDCDVRGPAGVNVTYESNNQDEIYILKSTAQAQPWRDLFFQLPGNYYCDTEDLASNGQGFELKRTKEACARWCLQFRATCIGFSWRGEAGEGAADVKRCKAFERTCRWVKNTHGRNANVNFDSYLLKGYEWHPNVLTTTPEGRYNGEHIDQLDDPVSYPKFRECGAQRITYSTQTDSRTFAQMSCEDGSTTAGMIHETGYVYYRTTSSNSKCASLCYEWNLNPANSEECRGFNQKTIAGDTNNFKCQLFNCNIYLNSSDTTAEFEVFNPSDTSTIYDQWGYLENFRYPECRGVHKAQHDIDILGDYDITAKAFCSATHSNLLYTYTWSSAHRCANLCKYRFPECMAFHINNDRECKLYRSCVPLVSSYEHTRLWARKDFSNRADGLYNKAKPFLSSSCKDVVGANLFDLFTDVDYDTISCKAKCDEAGNDCAYFEVTEPGTFDCKIWSHCPGGPTEWVDGVSTFTRGTVAYEPLSESAPTPAPTPYTTPAPTPPPECQVSTDCVPENEICDSTQDCIEISCSKHSDCYGNMLPTRLPMCDHKKGYCVDLFSSSCSTLRRCRSIARRKWRQQRSLGKARMKNAEKRQEKREQLALEAIQRLQSSIAQYNDTNTIYVGVKGSETVEVDGSMIGLIDNQNDIFQAIVDARCGSEKDECSFEVVEGARRLEEHGRFLQDQNVTITISYDIDEQVYQDLVDSGYDFGSDNLTQAIAESLNISASQVNLVNNDGEIEVEITVIDDTADGQPIGDDFLEDIENIQNDLTNITDDLVQELGISEEDISLTSVDYCGDRTCTNRGTCVDETGLCDCDPGYQGVDCEIDRTCATDSDCLNGGVCADDKLQCHCNYPFTGPTCSDQVDCSC